MQFQYTVKPSVSEHLPVQELRDGPLAGGVLICLREETKTKLETKHEKTATREGLTNAPEHVF